MADKERGICPVCGQERDLTNAGVMRMHLGADATHIWRDNCAGVGCPPSSIVVDPVAAAESRGRTAGYEEAMQRLRDLSPEFVALAIQDVSYGGTQVAAWHARHLGRAALDAIIDTVEASAPARATTEETPR